jgi:hypothetical protein
MQARHLLIKMNNMGNIKRDITRFENLYMKRIKMMKCMSENTKKLGDQDPYLTSMPKKFFLAINLSQF